MTKAPASLLVAILFLAGARAVVAAEHWENIGSDKDALGNDMRTLEIDSGSIRSTADGVSVHERITSIATGHTGYNCSEGAMRHPDTTQQIAELLCSRGSAANPQGAHVADWLTLATHRTSREVLTSQVDLNSVARVGDEAMVLSRDLIVQSLSASYDCKGYYRTFGAWRSVDRTDPIAPRNSVSLERKVATRLCGASK